MKGSNSVEEGKAWAFIGILLGFLGFILVLLAKKDNRYAMHYAKQGLVLSIAYVILWVVGMIPILGWIVYIVGSIALLVLWIIGLVYSLSGEEKIIPVVGSFAEKINL